MSKIHLNLIRVLSVSVLLLACTVVQAEEADAKRILKAMSDYLAGQEALSFDYDATLEVVTVDGQVLGLASSGSLSMQRPDKFRATRQGGHVNAEMIFDGKVLTLFGKNANMYTQVQMPGSIDHAIDELKDTYGRPLPAADLMLSNSYDAMMEHVTDIKDLGSGFIGGIECDSLAFRTDEVDWQIWIAQGDKPVPCRYVITSRDTGNGLQYRIQFNNWGMGSAATNQEFSFANTSDAQKVDLEDLQGMEDLPANFSKSEGGS